MMMQSFFLADGSTLNIEDTSSSISSDNTWKFNVKRVPYLFQNKTGEREFKVEDNLKIELDGKEYAIHDLLKQSTRKSFNSIEWKGRSCEFESRAHLGTLTTSNGKIFIGFNT